MPNTPKVNRDQHYEQPQPMKQSRSRRRPGRALNVAKGRDPRKRS
jgi:hypothetical protein